MPKAPVPVLSNNKPGDTLPPEPNVPTSFTAVFTKSPVNVTEAACANPANPNKLIAIIFL